MNLAIIVALMVVGSVMVGNIAVIGSLTNEIKQLKELIGESDELSEIIDE